MHCIMFPPNLASEIANTTMRDLVLHERFWRPGYLTKETRICPYQHLCVGGTTVSSVYERSDNSTCLQGSGVSGAYCMVR